MKTMVPLGYLINDNGDDIRDSRNVASILNKYFVLVLSAEETNNLPIIDTSRGLSH